MTLDPATTLIAAAVVISVLFLLLTRAAKGSPGKTPDWEKFSLALNKIEHAVLLVSPDGNIDWVNPAFTRISGYPMGEVAGKPIGPLLLGSCHSPKAAQ